MSISDTMVLMNHGKIEQIPTPLEIYKCPRTQFAAEFIGLTNFLDARVIEFKENQGKASPYGLQLTAKWVDQFEVGETVQIVFRPEMIHLSEPGGNTMEGKVWEVAFLGPITRYTIEPEGGTTITLDDQNPKILYQRWSKVHLENDENSLHIQRPQNREVTPEIL